MATQEDKAQQFVQQAEKKLQGGGGFFSFFGGGNKTEEAADLFTKAANAYKMAKKWREAGDCFTRVAELQKEGSKHESATNYINAATAYKKVWADGAVVALTQAVECYTDMGKFTMAAKQEMVIAEIYETDIVDLEKACEAYSQAADWFLGEDQNSSANKALLKVAQYSAQLEKYDRAIEIYEKVAAQSIDNNLLKWGAKEYYLKAGLCHMCSGDILTARRAVDRYKEQFPSFQDQRECKFLEDLLQAMEDEDVEKFTNVVAEYDNMTRLDAWMTSILLRIKKTMTEEESLT
eukprot:comp19205_c0_seq1/m.21940 comp19205_c0_seq1/g.21940  ORF comp19205_c0_seq1/g.21940 comp19205_c0_seq1/m.21940 type:complete len:292 (-) comp19205_c0_seq1:92-967(-)